jgi:hypothetical protein
MQILTRKLLESTFKCTKPQVHIMSELTAIIISLQGPFLPTVLQHLILALWAVYHVESNSDAS